ncbi:MAG TPA: hypothetical protein VHC69_07455 [Polyangiaceae bacterium]|nr:hypothetical protein [Polyangiaceae bacterium]
MADVERCETGLENASIQPSIAQGMQTYLTECAGVYSEPACRQAFLQAAAVDNDRFLPTVVPPCRKAYCGALSAQHLKLCDAADPISAADELEGWPPLHNAILARDAGEYAPRLTEAMAHFYLTVQKRFAAGAPSAKPGKP